MLIIRSPKLYDSRIAKLLNCRTKSEPWLHIAVMSDGNSLTYARTKSEHDKERIYYAIYVWDTREVVEAGIVDVNDNQNLLNTVMNYLSKVKKSLQAFHAKSVKDNGKPLKSSDKAVQRLNYELFTKRK